MVVEPALKIFAQVIAANDITAVFLTIPLIFYLNRKNKAFWCGVGQLVAAVANFLPLLAFLLVPSTYVKSGITAEEEVELCSSREGQEREDCAAGGSQDEGADWGKVAALGCFFVCKGRTHYIRKNLNSIQTLQSAFWFKLLPR